MGGSALGWSGRSRPVARALRTALAWLPTLQPAAAARRIVQQANAARDARRFAVAAALYAEAIRLWPANARIRKQCGHMNKEAGDFVAAELNYKAAYLLDPEDADLQLQLGHFYKLAGQPDEAAAAYARALEMRPGWADALAELARIPRPGGPAPVDGGPVDMALLAPELLPATDTLEPIHADGIRVMRLGAARVRTASGYRRVLRGVEAIRGYCITSAEIRECVLVLDGTPIAREPVQRTRLGTDAADRGAKAKFVFNLWHDFSGYDAGDREIELRLLGEGGWSRTHRASLRIADPVDPDTATDSDAALPLLGNHDLERQVRALPSVVRSARRALLNGPPRAILVQRVDQLGDLVVSVPAIRQLRGTFPESRLVGLVTQANVGLARALGLFDEVIVADFMDDGRGGRTMALGAQQALRERLSAFAFDLAIDLAETGESRPLLALSGASILYGFKDRDYPWLTAGFELQGHDPINHLDIVSPAAKLTAMVDALARMIDSPARTLRLAEAERRHLAAAGLNADDDYIVLHAGARLHYSRWPHFEALARTLLERTSSRIVLLGTDGASIDIASARLTIIDGLLDFAVFDALLGFARLFIGNDSGPKHLAALRGTPVISLHMARLNWNEWGQEPVGSIISRRVPCAGCAIGREPEECGKAYACLTDIRSDEVADAALKLAPGPRGSGTLPNDGQARGVQDETT